MSASFIIADMPLAPFATQWRQSRGRLIAEPGSPTRSDFQRDRDRIIHCAAFRRLAHKTQVFIPIEGDHFRTRLTHSLEVSQIARALAHSLHLDEDLAEALALVHDIGHTPFGHVGEDVLAECMAGHGGFDHNGQALRVVTRLEQRYARFDGLNLTWETLEGLVKHNGPLLDHQGNTQPKYREHGVPTAIVDFDRHYPLGLQDFAGPEAQVAAIADDIAYNAHDIDDGLRAGIFELDQLRQLDFLRDILTEIECLHPQLAVERKIYELTRRLITRFVEAAIVASQHQLATISPVTVEGIRQAAQPIIILPPDFVAVDRAIKGFLYRHLYRHPTIMRIRIDAALILRSLFEFYVQRLELVPQAQPVLASPEEPMRNLADYLAGMTDRFAVSEYRRLIGPAPDLR